MGTETSCRPIYNPDQSGKKYLPEILSRWDFLKLVKNTDRGDYVKFLIDHSDGERAYFQDTGHYPFHFPFLKSEILKFSGLTAQIYENLVFSPGQKIFSAGAIYYLPCSHLNLYEKKDLLGFNVYFKHQISVAEINKVAVTLRERVPFVQNRLVYLFQNQRDYFKFKKRLSKIGISSVPMNRFFKTIERPTAYHSATSYGYLKSISPREYQEGNYTNKDILIFSRVPLDIGPLSGVISIAPQVPNSHVVLRTVNQNIPNIYIPKALDEQSIKSHLGQLIKFTVSPQGSWKLEGAAQLGPEVLQKESNAYFKSRRPDLPPLEFDLRESKIFSINEKTPSPALAKIYGAKGANFALMNQVLKQQGHNRELFRGTFLIPFSWYANFLQAPISQGQKGRVSDACKKKKRKHCQRLAKMAQPSQNLSSLINALVAPPLTEYMLANSSFRKEALWYLRSLIKGQSIPAASLELLRITINKNYPSSTRMRFRSSTNAEDLPGINGAGLYDSKAACLADELTPDENKSACRSKGEILRLDQLIASLRKNPNENTQLIAQMEKKKSKKYPLEKAIKGVYASMWNERAFLYRNYLGLDQQKVFMGILVHPSFTDESANGVVISRESGGSIELNVTAQIGDISITNPILPNTSPDYFTLKQRSDGNVLAEYYGRSNQTRNSLPVLSPKEIDSLYQQTQVLHERIKKIYAYKGEVSFDLEFKRDAQGEILIKQIRPLIVSPTNRDEGLDLPSKGTFYFWYSNHQWHSLDLTIGPFKFQFDTPEGDASNPNRNMSWGYRPKISYNRVNIEKDGKPYFSSSMWSDLLPEDKKLYNYYCRRVISLREITSTSFPIPLSDFYRDFGISADDGCKISVSRPEKYSTPFGESYTRDQICAIEFNGKKAIVYVPWRYLKEPVELYLNEWPKNTIHACIDGKKIDLKDQRP